MSSAPASRPRVYLAGPDLFFPDGAARYARLRGHCQELGFEAVAPFEDGEAADSGGLGEDELARRIYESNVALIRSADAVLANLVDFRGAEPDSGTVFEVGYAVALGKPVVAYGVPDRSYAERVSASVACAAGGDGQLRELASGVLVEGLGQRLNLMLSRSVQIAAGAREALLLLARKL